MSITVSSKRVMENIEDLKSENILKLRPVTFIYIKDGEREINVGLIAEEVFENLPNMVILDNEDQPFIVKYDQICMYLLSEVKKLRESVDYLLDLNNKLQGL